MMVTKVYIIHDDLKGSVSILIPLGQMPSFCIIIQHNEEKKEKMNKYYINFSAQLFEDLQLMIKSSLK